MEHGGVHFCNLKEYKSIFNYISPKCDFSLGFFMIINTKASPSSPPKKGKSHSHNTKNSYNFRIDPKGHDLTRPSRISHRTTTIRTQGVTACSYRAVYHAGRLLRVSANTHEYNHSNQIIKTSKLSKPNTNRHNPSYLEAVVRKREAIHLLLREACVFVKGGLGLQV